MQLGHGLSAVKWPCYRPHQQQCLTEVCLLHVGNLSNSPELKQLLESNETSSGFQATARLAWGIMLRLIGDDTHQNEGEESMSHASACNKPLLQQVSLCSTAAVQDSLFKNQRAA